MNQSERLHTEISKLSDNHQCSFFDAVLIFCEENLYEPEDVIKQMDSITKDRIKQSAIDDRLLRKTEMNERGLTFSPL